VGTLLNCKKATKLLMEAGERKLKPSETVWLEFHLVKCSCCRRFKGQMGFIRAALHQYAERGTP
jgi:predicted anti-sigma-YlaC factor YlaD